MISGLHANTITSKMNQLRLVNLIKIKKRGCQVLYFVLSDIKEAFEEWATTEEGKRTIREFSEQLSEIMKE